MSTTPNQTKLTAFVAVCIAEAPAQYVPAAFLQRQADHVERQLQALSFWTAQGKEPPAHLVGLTAFDLSDALDQLSAAAMRVQAIAA
jgi:hypothetical protein